MSEREQELLNQANTARRVAYTLATAIYRFAGKECELSELVSTVDELLREDLVLQLKHRFILKDSYPQFINHLPVDAFGDDFTEDDTDTFQLKDGD